MKIKRVFGMVAAALIIADKSDVRQSRVREKVEYTDIHDRVNYSVKKRELKNNNDHTIIKLKLEIDTKVSSVMDYFEIFLTRMLMCKSAAAKLNIKFKLIINEQTLILEIYNFFTIHLLLLHHLSLQIIYN